MLCDLSTCRCWPHTLDGRNPLRPYPLLDIASEFIGSAACSYTEMVQTVPTSDRNGVVQTWVLQNWIVCLVLNTSLRQVLATSRTLSQEMLISRIHNGRGNRCLDITILVEIIDKETPLQSSDLVGETVKPHMFSAELPHVGWIHGFLSLKSFISNHHTKILRFLRHPKPIKSQFSKTPFFHSSWIPHFSVKRYEANRRLGTFNVSAQCADGYRGVAVVEEQRHDELRGLTEGKN